MKPAQPKPMACALNVQLSQEQRVGRIQEGSPVASGSKEIKGLSFTASVVHHEVSGTGAGKVLD